MGKEIKLGNGLRLTESEDMGMFMHYESKSGNHTGIFMGNTDDTPGHKWAAELLEGVEDREDYDPLED
jgi:hypothetical protein